MPELTDKQNSFSASQMRIIIASDIDRDNIFAEIYHGDELWAEVFHDSENNQFKVKIFAPNSKEGYVFEVAQVQQILEKAKHSLL